MGPAHLFVQDAFFSTLKIARFCEDRDSIQRTHPRLRRGLPSAPRRTLVFCYRWGLCRYGNSVNLSGTDTSDMLDTGACGAG